MGEANLWHYFLHMRGTLQLQYFDSLGLYCEGSICQSLHGLNTFVAPATRNLLSQVKSLPQLRSIEPAKVWRPRQPVAKMVGDDELRFYSEAIASGDVILAA